MLSRMLMIASLGLALVACGAAEDDDPESAPGPDAGSAVVEPDGGSDATPLAYMEACDLLDDQCADELICFNFNSRGPYCTHDCASDADCPAPSRGCNNKGVCKAP